MVSAPLTSKRSPPRALTLLDSKRDDGARGLRGGGIEAQFAVEAFEVTVQGYAHLGEAEADLAARGLQLCVVGHVSGEGHSGGKRCGGKQGSHVLSLRLMVGSMRVRMSSRSRK